MDTNVQGKHSSSIILEHAMTVYLNVWNMNCPKCADFLRKGLSQMCGVLHLDVFYRQGVAVVTYDPELIETVELLKAVAKIGQDVSHYYGAEVIGHCPAQQALR